ncbi:uncharacterized protein NEMAJ01_1206 [Nematocida major]|uniref:uncharacterized protein n=1 Tax=Nematocida major TaxID=1912982 RepID=UPI00200770D2|nr:uncharacterized protein NEMAJ01_1206 [Nematocida major]KAH9386310.1 hypothetical protein NEMAJ01_1206 [Nematocida major]
MLQSATWMRQKASESCEGCMWPRASNLNFAEGWGAQCAHACSMPLLEELDSIKWLVAFVRCFILFFCVYCFLLDGCAISTPVDRKLWPGQSPIGPQQHEAAKVSQHALFPSRSKSREGRQV